MDHTLPHLASSLVERDEQQWQAVLFIKYVNDASANRYEIGSSSESLLTRKLSYDFVHQK